MSSELPIFLTVDDVLAFHRTQIEKFGGDAAVRDFGLLESALAQPRQMFAGAYLHEDVASMAAAYLFHLVQNHPFADGNKRTGAYAALIFLRINGNPIIPPVDAMEALVLQVATGNANKEQVAEFFRGLMSELKNGKP
jgi:death-on-curing protein